MSKKLNLLLPPRDTQEPHFDVFPSRLFLPLRHIPASFPPEWPYASHMPFNSDANIIHKLIYYNF